MARSRTVTGLSILCLLVFATTQAGAANELREESQAEFDARMGWWRDAKFGLFVHWGLYATPGGEWNGKVYGGISEWIMAHSDIPRGDYERLADALAALL